MQIRGIELICRLYLFLQGMNENMSTEIVYVFHVLNVCT